LPFGATAAANGAHYRWVRLILLVAELGEAAARFGERDRVKQGGEAPVKKIVEKQLAPGGHW
jgi:hypothetical protein